MIGPRRFDISRDGLLGRSIALAIGLAGSLVIMLVVLGLFGANPADVLLTLLTSSTTNVYTQSDAVLQAVPILLLALGGCICFRARFWNIGGEAYFYVGALVTVAMGLHLSAMPAWLLLPLIALAAGVAGAALSGIAGFLRAYYGLNEVVVTLMMNLAILQVVAFAVRAPLADPTSRLGYTAMLPAPARLPILPLGLPNLHLGVLVAGLLAVVTFWLMRRSRFGHRIAALGANYEAAVTSGINGPRTILVASLCMGLLGGLAGMLYVSGTSYRLYIGLSPAPGYGYIAILTALLAELNPLWSVVSTLFYTLLNGSSGLLQVKLGIQGSFMAIFFSLILIGVLAGGAIARGRTSV